MSIGGEQIHFVGKLVAQQSQVAGGASEGSNKISRNKKPSPWNPAWLMMWWWDPYMGLCDFPERIPIEIGGLYFIPIYKTTNKGKLITTVLVKKHFASEIRFQKNT